MFGTPISCPVHWNIDPDFSNCVLTLCTYSLLRCAMQYNILLKGYYQYLLFYVFAIDAYRLPTANKLLYIRRCRKPLYAYFFGLESPAPCQFLKIVRGKAIQHRGPLKRNQFVLFRFFDQFPRLRTPVNVLTNVSITWQSGFSEACLHRKESRRMLDEIDADQSTRLV